MPRHAETPLTAAEFARLMAPLGPFEPEPRLAVGVSGGADSLALAVLADGWARARGGEIVGLTVDHRLRRGSGAEAREVGRRLAGRGIRHHVLARTGPAPATGVQAAARAARHALLAEWCRRHRTLHLLLAHHRDDQAETFLLRLAAGSGADGLACMPALAERRDLRVLRPLIGTPPGRLRAVLAARRMGWIEDPSNLDETFARVRVRRAMPGLAADGVDGWRLAAAARSLGLARAALEHETAGLLARAATVDALGYCVIDRQALADAPQALLPRALARVLMCVGGHVYPPRGERLDRLCRRIADDALAGGRTLAGCQIVLRGEGLLVMREPRAAVGRVAAGPGDVVHWDGRFRIRLGGRRRAGGPLCEIAALGAEAWPALVRAHPGLAERGVPAAVRASLPALFDRRGLVAVPQLGWRRRSRGAAAFTVISAKFEPLQPLTPATFAVV